MIRKRRKKKITKQHLITRDWLAIERTRLSNERTFLSYFRTAIVFLGTGITIIKLEMFSEVKAFGIILICISPFLLGIGVVRLIYVRRLIRSHYEVTRKF
ncbi:DUF202 domain-containing protein [Mangrovimonas aestuarii]|uniref:DUF202 domain-containing protein n=1 Tax=Mangrovimonas aestuarii TaxID=3018443 RepID=UPI002377DE20|nr:DUF202 domain-containing protein [Mangrovimonas aestuarii]